MARLRHSKSGFAKRPARTKLNRLWWVWLTFAGLASANVDLQGAVQLGKHIVAASEVKHALDECQGRLTLGAQKSLQEEPLDCLRRAWVPRWLLNVHIADQPQIDLTAYEENDLLHRALVEKIETNEAPASPAEIDEYLSKHQRDFTKPLRLRLFRILVASKSDAEEVIEELGAPVSIEEFRKVARAHSLDTATHERGGDLGFVWPDGSTDIPQVSAEPILYQSAIELKDGQLAEKPIQEGERFSVLWRRGSLPALEPDAGARQIAALRIQEARTDQSIDALLAKNSQQVTGKSPLLLGLLRRPGTKLFEER